MFSRQKTSAGNDHSPKRDGLELFLRYDSPSRPPGSLADHVGEARSNAHDLANPLHLSLAFQPETPQNMKGRFKYGHLFFP